MKLAQNHSATDVFRAQITPVPTEFLNALIHSRRSLVALDA